MNSNLTARMVNSNTATKNEKIKDLDNLTLKDIIRDMDDDDEKKTEVQSRLNSLIDATLSLDIPDDDGWNESKEKIAEAKNLIATILYVIEYYDLFSFEHYDITNNELDQIILTVDESRLDKLFENVETMRGSAGESEASEKDYCEPYCVLKKNEKDDKKITAFFEKLRLKNEFAEYKKENYYEENVKLSVDAKGHALLARDKDGRTLWAYKNGEKASMKRGYTVYLKDKNGDNSEGVDVLRSKVVNASSVFNGFIENYNIKLSSDQIKSADTRIKNFDKKATTEYVDDGDNIKTAKAKLYEYIIKELLKAMPGDKKNMKVYIEHVNNREWRIGIWSDEMEEIYSKLHIEGVSYQAFKKNAQAEGFYMRATNRGGYQHTVSSHCLKEYDREEKSPYIFLLKIEKKTKDIMLRAWNTEPSKKEE